MNRIKHAEYPWPPEEKYAPFRRLDILAEDKRADFIRDFHPIRTLWNEAIAPWAPVPLWKDGAPGYDASFDQPQPSLGLRTHAGAPRGTVIVAAGGAFLWKAAYEGPDAAERFYAEGFNAAVLDYRVAPYAPLDALADAKRAIRTLREGAGRYGILPDRIAMLGFSAGGRLTGMAATMFDSGDAGSGDPIERVSSRPDAAILCYGASSQAACPQRGLSYNREEQRLLAARTPDTCVRADCPPFFLWQCSGQDDPRNGMNLAARLVSMGVPVELHIFPNGPHGTALSDGGAPQPGSDDPHVAHWVELCCEWLRELGF